ncbi:MULTISPECIES: YheC/YheD family protein [unclassified Bacillus (in: firmicutes)]|uniref:YheC/YheD family endospore coat-associated protein n=1 Tax=unclassified Bacillus (in: firmicutes) TaxID=185979 RepID=UPI0008F282EA|nr:MULTISPECIES: YheC/YheD family protein [unclassified Bacillus (in: firmicutes)]SFA80169.1 YheC/D like ATP-grasp [Bacillus sp. UNCCL13]SFQ70224.1 YheC/D like ATP-grasp [Bacillus sp. cl95]
MYTLGFMSLNHESEASYFTEVAKRAALRGIVCYRFIPTSINPLTQLVKGKKFEPTSHDWVDCEFPLPSVLYDRCFYGDDPHSKKAIPIVTWLKNRDDIRFLGYGLPNKIELYKTLANTELAPYLPPSQQVNSYQTVFNRLENWKKIMLKPITGSQGYGIYYIEKKEFSIIVKTEKNGKVIERTFTDIKKMQAWLEKLLQNHLYLVQPYFELRDSSDLPFDIRILLQKNAEGKWTERGKGIRKGQNEGILSNLCAGGKTLDYRSWTESISKEQARYIHGELSYIVKLLPTLLENEFPSLFEMGVDIGVAKDGAVWILDINSKPGRKVIVETCPEMIDTLYQAPFLYGSFVHQNEVKGLNSHHAKTLHH